MSASATCAVSFENSAGVYYLRFWICTICVFGFGTLQFCMGRFERGGSSNVVQGLRATIGRL